MRVLVQTDNIGYAKACNVGILASRGAAIVALNPDAFAEPCWLERMGAHLSDGVAAVGPVSDAITGNQFIGNYITGQAPVAAELSGRLASDQAGTAIETKLLMGVCLVMCRDILDKHGLLCEETELGADDLEFSWRYRQLGYELPPYS